MKSRTLNSHIIILHPVIRFTFQKCYFEKYWRSELKLVPSTHHLKTIILSYIFRLLITKIIISLNTYKQRGDLQHILYHYKSILKSFHEKYAEYFCTCHIWVGKVFLIRLLTNKMLKFLWHSLPVNLFPVSINLIETVLFKCIFA